MLLLMAFHDQTSPPEHIPGFKCRATVVLLTFGEGWHNNHHAHPQATRQGPAWYELDLNWYGISALRSLRLASDVKEPKFNFGDDKKAATPRGLAA
jgi:stearoyl-CoA desaturase (delta-9 desaturase)